MKKHLLIFFLLVSQLGWAQTEVKREVFGRDIGQLIGIRFTGRIIDEITEEALVDQLPTQMASLIIQETILLNSKKK
ncbi:hypothetical protein V8V91_20735 [Algoriphagus halophilus]|uniref:hypothetical protein n=1 Tax=Algoriphagus halophilus TaxID=226505 RepID=UPI00358FC52B